MSFFGENEGTVLENACQIKSGGVKFRDFRFCNCGYEESDPGQGFGPAIKNHYVLHYVLSGCGVFGTNDRQYAVTRGEAFLICPDERAYYRADTDDPWSYLWVGFDGDKAEEYLREMKLLGVKKPVFRIRNGFALKQIVTEMLKCNHSGLDNEFALQGLFCRFFSVVSVEVTGRGKKAEESGRQNYYIKKAITFIRDNYSNGINVSDVSEYVGLNRSYLFTLFQEHLGISPQKYLSNFRLERACELLQATNYSIEDISYSCGYRDPLVFSKAFKKLYGVSPLKYRKEL